MALYYKNRNSLRLINNKAKILISTLLRNHSQTIFVHILHDPKDPKKVVLYTYLYGILFIELNFPDFTSPAELYKKLTNEVNTQRLLGTIPTV